jgi:hypothetical protein
MFGHRPDGTDCPRQGMAGGLLADPFLALVHHRGDAGDERAAFGVGDVGDFWRTR